MGAPKLKNKVLGIMRTPNGNVIIEEKWKNISRQKSFFSKLVNYWSTPKVY